MDQADEWAEQTQSKLDQQYTELQPGGSQAVASGFAESFDETFGAELTEVIPKLAELVVVGGEAMPSDDAGV